MPGNFDKSRTPLERRRAPKGSTLGLFPTGRHTLESFQHFAALQAQLGVNAAETIRQALARAVHVEPLVALVSLTGGELLDGVWHWSGCPARRWSRPPCAPTCSAARLALQELGALPK